MPASDTSERSSSFEFVPRCHPDTPPRATRTEKAWLPQRLRPEPDADAPIHYDLFCGPGGFATGFEWAGFQTAVGIDIHPPSLNTFSEAHPEAATLQADIRTVEARDILELAGAVPADVMTAGIPCEGFSRSNRNRNSFVDARNFLFLEFLRIAAELSPQVVLIENVQALTTHSDGFFRDEILLGLEDLGYTCDMKVLNAADFGVPQRRRRVIFVGVKDGLRWSWPKESHGERAELPHRTVADAISDLPPVPPSGSTESYEDSPGNAYQSFLRGRRSKLLNHIAPTHPQKTIDRIDATPQGQPMYPRFKQRIRLHPNELSPTVVSGGIRPQFAHGHPWIPRGLTIRERARLQSFPDHYDFTGGVTQGRVQTGDAVPPLMAWRLAEQVMCSLQGTHNPERSLKGVASPPKQLALV